MKISLALTCVILITLLSVQQTTSFIRHGRDEITERFRLVENQWPAKDLDQAVPHRKYIIKSNSCYLFDNNICFFKVKN